VNEAETASEVAELLRQAKLIACRYYALTGKPLGITGEVAEYEAAGKLGLTLGGARTAHHDAISARGERIQIKGRAVNARDPYRGRVPKIRTDGDFDCVLLVLLDKASLDAIEILRAEKMAVERLLDRPGSKARNERRSPSIMQFKAISERVWPSAT
jgi:hypothetical protein